MFGVPFRAPFGVPFRASLGLSSRSLIVGAATIALTSLAQALAPVQAPAQQPTGTTVQLPVVNQFSIGTVVSVPDGGTMRLGGVTRRSASSSSNGLLGGPFSNRSNGVSSSSSNASVTVHILSNREMSEDVLAAARAARPANYEEIQAQKRKASFLTRNMGRNRQR